MVITEKSVMYKIVLHKSHQLSIPTTIYTPYRKSTLLYWKRQYFLIRSRIVHNCILRQLIFNKQGLDHYMSLHISKLCINQK